MPMVHAVVVLRKQPLSRCEDAPAADANLTAVAVTGENQVDWIMGKLGVVLRVMTQEHLVLLGCGKGFQKRRVQQ